MDKTKSIRGRIFSSDDLQQIAERIRVLVNERVARDSSQMNIVCTRSNGETHTHQIDLSKEVQPVVFQGAGRLVSVIMHAHVDEAFAIHLSVTHGSGDMNVIRVDGDDDTTVTGAFEKIHDLIGNAAPQGSVFRWLVTRPFLLVLPLAMLAAGQLLLRIGVERFPDVFASLDRWGQLSVVVLAGIVPALPVTWAVRWLFPRVEIDVGPAHLKRNKRVRSGLGALLGIVIGVLVGDLVTDLTGTGGTLEAADSNGN